MTATFERGQRMSEAGQHTEGPIAKALESQTSKLPSDTWLWAAGGSIAASLAFQMAGRKDLSLFVGQWAPTFLIIGVYNKLVKQLGADRMDTTA